MIAVCHATSDATKQLARIATFALMKTLAREECRAEIIGRLRTVRPDSTPRWGRMSAPQMVCHLADAYRVATGEMVVAPVAVPLPPVLMKCIALYLPLPWPRNIPTVPELDQHRGRGSTPADFATDVAQVEALINLLVTRDTWPPHAMFGRMSRKDWLRWGYLHPAHHLAQFGV